MKPRYNLEAGFFLGCCHDGSITVGGKARNTAAVKMKRAALFGLFFGGLRHQGVKQPLTGLCVIIDDIGIRYGRGVIRRWW